MTKERPSWDEYFMMVALLISTRASCQYYNAGAVIVNQEKRIIATGYNGAPKNIKNCLELGCRKDRLGIDRDEKNTGTCIGEHAERNALLHSKEQFKDSTMYSVLLPCTDCSKQIVGVGISRVVYLRMYEEPNNLVNELFDEAKIKLEKMDLDLDKIYEFLVFAKNRPFTK